MITGAKTFSNQQNLIAMLRPLCPSGWEISSSTEESPGTGRALKPSSLMSHPFGEFDVGPAEELQKKYGWYTENRIAPRLDLAIVPNELHDLVPLAERWGISCDITRHDADEKASRDEIAQVAKLLEGRHKQIYSWLYSDGGTSDEATAFQALLVFEMEEAGGPGIPGLLDWRIREFNDSPSDVNRKKLRDALDRVMSWSSVLREFQPIDKAVKILES